MKDNNEVFFFAMTYTVSDFEMSHYMLDVSLINYSIRP